MLTRWSSDCVEVVACGASASAGPAADEVRADWSGIVDGAGAGDGPLLSHATIATAAKTTTKRTRVAIAGLLSAWRDRKAPASPCARFHEHSARHAMKFLTTFAAPYR